MLRTVPTGSGRGKQVRGSRKRISREAQLCPGRPSARRAPVTLLLWCGKTGRSAFQCLQKLQQHSKASRRKEWTEQEDRMLTQLVQEMRVGSHIPYRKIVYYMEGRDSMQLIYRWTKSLDPSLKKGFWAPEEDAKLLRAVAKYGEQDWFKIRAEVPGISEGYISA
ncbi:snRNA-activating protein complex subunit 4-like isoform X2 [Pteropus vampyrus]|uniref:snRNA-activating protein complex subunit 4-like isoform X2 n=1 Tax=Pteropus vampyrus TaxID=132908 RepID=A0A6P6CY17_PTEVA|nr:snRNA-activating protein complex subunit 4-like isoform X2 [Pteropus vampyrus]